MATLNTNARNGVNLYPIIYDFNNLYRAYTDSKQGKRWKNSTVRFEVNALAELKKLQRDLENGTYKLGPYNVFRIFEPKIRDIKSIQFKHKVVQRSLCDNVLGPIFERAFIYDSYACRKGKGTHAGLDRTCEFFRRHYRLYGLDGWVLKCDIEKYFDSIDHKHLKRIVRKHIFDERVLKLLDDVIDSIPGGKGLPLGNQTSQWFAILFLNDFDHFIKERLGVKMYVRYMDDFVLIHHDKAFLQECKRAIIEYLDGLELKLNEKSHVFPLKNGIDFLGFHIYLTESGKVVKKIRRDSKDRVKRKLKKFKELYENGERTRAQIEQSYYSWRAHASHGNTYYLIQYMDGRFERIFEGDEENGAIIKQPACRGKG
ncbi:reverse transcriptase domain-containing protein [Cytobacillus firmus]|uniref:reverse transcriptase domain-containing protein n=1 Tax=Cytobacillus firmus TaxID=1399 RepID=UPI0018CC861D|nr:reverse transcriptase domain-containing protein [Cytobacillus firmus]MED1938956.1 reverse transcriptase domain-containing protein [Cytobacillus firmus]